MVQAKKDNADFIELEYATPLRSETRARKAVRKMAMLNMVFAFASVLSLFLGGNSSDRIAVQTWLVCSTLFGISYCILLILVLALTLGRNVRVQVWVSVWTIVIGLIAVVALIGFLCFMAVL